METKERALRYEEAKAQTLLEGLSLLGAPAHLQEKAASVTKKILLGEPEVFAGLEPEDIFRLAALAETLRMRKLEAFPEDYLGDKFPLVSWPFNVAHRINDVAHLLREATTAAELGQELELRETEPAALLDFLDIRAKEPLTTEAEITKASGLAKEQAAALLEAALTDRLGDNLETALQNGAKYQELLEIAEGFKLSSEIKQRQLENAIYSCFLGAEPAPCPRPKHVATELGAPLQLILKIYLQGWRSSS